MFCHKFSKVGLKDIDWCPRLRESLYVWGSKSSTLETTWVTLTSFRWEELLTCEAILDTIQLNIHSCIFTLCFFHEQILSSVLVITFNLSLGPRTHMSGQNPMRSFVQLICGYTLPPKVTHPCGSMHQLCFCTYDPHLTGFNFKRIFSVQMWPPFSSDPDMDKYRKVFKPKAPDAQLAVWGNKEFDQ